MITAQFEKVLKLNRSDLIFKRNKKNVNKKDRFAAPVIVTYHPQNPPVQRWIREDLGILHLSRQCREILPSIPVVTRQAKSVGQISVRSRHWQKTDQGPGQSTAGCTVLHKKNCVACKRIKETDRFENPVTGRQYSIRRSYTCKSSWIIYLARCKSHQCRYVGQSFDQRGFVGRHYGHRQDCQSGVGGLGQHFFQHHGGDMEDMEIVIIDSVQPGNHDLLDRKEEEWIHRLRTMDNMGQGGLNIRDDLKRSNRGKCKCKFCKK